MIREQEDKLNNMKDEMEQLRSTHASAFKNKPENLQGSVRDFTDTGNGVNPNQSSKKFMSPLAKAT